MNKEPKFWGLMVSKVILGHDHPIKLKDFGHVLIKPSQSNFNLQSSDSNLVLSYLITTVQWRMKFWFDLKFDNLIFVSFSLFYFSV